MDWLHYLLMISVGALAMWLVGWIDCKLIAREQRNKKPKP